MRSHRTALFSALSLCIGAIASESMARTAADHASNQVIAACRKSDATPAEQGNCLYQEAKRARTAMEASFLALKSHEEQAHRGERFDLRPELDLAQQAWQRWADAECRVQADVSRGTAGSIDGPECTLRLTRQRQRELVELMKED